MVSDDHGLSLCDRMNLIDNDFVEQ